MKTTRDIDLTNVSKVSKNGAVRIEGFTNDIESTVDNALVIALYGQEGTGKTTFIASAPGPIGVVPLDRKTRFSIAKRAKELGRRDIYMPKDDFIRHSNPIKLSLMKEAEAKTYYTDHVKRVMECAYKFLDHPDFRTVAVDNGSQLWEDMLFKHFGRNQRIMPRDRGPVNQDMIDFLAAMTGKHFILTHKSREQWKDDKPIGKFEPAGLNAIGYHVTVVMEMARNPQFNPDIDKPPFNWQFSATIRHCQHNPLLQVPNSDNVMKDENISFQNLAMMIYPDADWSEFQMEAGS